MSKALLQRLLRREIYIEYPIKGYREVFQAMRLYNVRSLPVLKRESKEFIGVLRLSRIIAKFSEPLFMLIERNPPIISESYTLDKVLKYMLSNSLWEVPYVSSSGEFLGVIRLQDIVKYYWSYILSRWKTHKLVKDIKGGNVLALWSKTPANIAAISMKYLNSEIALVLDDEGKAVGAVFLVDLLAEGEEITREKQSSLSTGSEDQEWDWTGETIVYISKKQYVISRRPIGELTESLSKVYENGSLSSALKVLSASKRGWAFVVDAYGEIKHPVSVMDILKHIIAS
ncbi:MAG TPA: hypothetical protein EYH40_05345 [Desulfurococcales archaeon]|nr:hypothetical protein [Desulfurococcales archaeon]